MSETQAASTRTPEIQQCSEAIGEVSARFKDLPGDAKQFRFVATMLRECLREFNAHWENMAKLGFPPDALDDTFEQCARYVDSFVQETTTTGKHRLTRLDDIHVTLVQVVLGDLSKKLRKRAVKVKKKPVQVAELPLSDADHRALEAIRKRLERPKRSQLPSAVRACLRFDDAARERLLGNAADPFDNVIARQFCGIGGIGAIGRAYIDRFNYDLLFNESRLPYEDPYEHFARLYEERAYAIRRGDDTSWKQVPAWQREYIAAALRAHARQMRNRPRAKVRRKAKVAAEATV
jgi:hypothetical protein